MTLAACATVRADFAEWPIVSTGTASVLDERIDRVLSKVSRQKEQQTDREVLHSIFKRTQKEFLHRYKPYADLNELVKGDFDCLTATSLFATVLTRAGFDFRIIETNYHIFLLVSTAEGEVLLETTDRFAGFVTSGEAIAKKIEGYRNQLPETTSDRVSYLYCFDVFGEIETTELTGLLYFNQAVKAYNAGSWLSCSEKIRLAGRNSSSPRIAALASVLLCKISVTEIDEAERDAIKSNLVGFESSYPLTSRRD